MVAVASFCFFLQCVSQLWPTFDCWCTKSVCTCESLVVWFFITQGSLVHTVRHRVYSLVMRLVSHVCQGCKGLTGSSEVQRLHVSCTQLGRISRMTFLFFSCMFNRYWCCILVIAEMNKNVIGTQMMACAASVCCAPWELPTHQAARSSRLMGYYLKVLPDIVVESILSTFPLSRLFSPLRHGSGYQFCFWNIIFFL